jgi:hypothetical protein
MRFVFVGTSRGARGTETHLLCLVRALARAGHEVLTVARPEGFISRELAASGLPVEPGIFRNAVDVRGARAVLRALRRMRPDWLVGSFGHEYWPLLVLGRSTGTRVALFRHLNSPPRPVSRAVLPNLAHRFIAVSESSWRTSSNCSEPPPRCRPDGHGPEPFTTACPGPR